MPWALPGRLAALPGREGPALPGREGPALPGRFFSADCLLKCNTGNSVAVHHCTVWYKDPQLLALYLSLKIWLFFLGLPNYWCSIYTGRVVLLDRFSWCGLPCWGENTKIKFFAYNMQYFENRYMIIFNFLWNLYFWISYVLGALRPLGVGVILSPVSVHASQCGWTHQQSAINMEM